MDGSTSRKNMGFCCVLLLSTLTTTGRAQDTTVLSEDIELPRLVDLCVKRLDLSIQYDAAVLKGKLTLRLGGEVTDDELWTLTNRLLASKGFTSIQMAGEDTLSIVRLNEASGLARLETGSLDEAVAGFVKLRVPITHRKPDELQALLKQAGSAGGKIQALGSSGTVIVADLVPHVHQILELLEFLDQPGPPTRVENLSLQFATAADVVTQAEKVATTWTAVTGEKYAGKLLAAADGGSVQLVAPEGEVAFWTGVVNDLDQGERREPRDYSPTRFPMADIEKLIEQLIPGAGPQEKDGFKLVRDELTGTLIVHATERQHQLIQQLIDRLEEVPRSKGVLEEVPVEHLSPSAAVAQIEELARVETAVTGDSLVGKLVPAPGGEGVLVIAPPEEMERWRGWVERIDRPSPLETVTYTPHHFAVQDVAPLVERMSGADRDPPPGWDMVTDDLTGTLVVTATERQHEKIREFLDRLNDSAPSTRRPLRSFTLQNRNAADLVGLLQQLVTGPQDTVTGEVDAQDEGDRLDPDIPAPPEIPGRPGEPAADPAGSAQDAPGSSPSAALFGMDGEELLLTADEATNSVIAVGEPRLLDQLERLILDLDRRQPQVMIEVLVLTVTDNEALQLGVELQRRATNDDSVLTRLSSLFGLGSPAFDGATLNDPGTGFTGVALDPGHFTVLLQALESLNDGRSMTVPRVLVNNHEEAQLDSVLETPYISTNASNTVATTSFGGSLEAGTMVTVTPRIAEADHLVLEYSVRVSQFVGEAADPSLPPPRQQNTLQSVVTIPDGHRIVLGGLEIETISEAVSRIPLLGSIPWLGHLFESRSTSVNRSRFYLFLGATVMRAEKFEDLRFLSRAALVKQEVDSGWPVTLPQVMR